VSAEADAAVDKLAASLARRKRDRDPSSVLWLHRDDAQAIVDAWRRPTLDTVDPAS
jgi:hypothetical protein